MTRLRVALPALDELTLDSLVDYAWLDRLGQVSREGQSTLAQLGKTAKPVAVECYLHPQDSLLASIELPPLPAAKISAAVQCAAEALILGASGQMCVAHGPRDEDGKVQIGWLPRESLQCLGQRLRDAGLKLRGVYPAAYALPVHAMPVACVQAEHLLVRYGMQHAAVHPIVDQALNDLLLMTGSAVQWIGDGAPHTLHAALPGSQRWTGQPPGWGLHTGVQNRAAAQPGWGRAAALCAVALVVWTLGLNLYAARAAHEGQQLKTQMSQRVKQAFPELPVILNPLQQARQQLTARQAGGVADPAQRFSNLVQQAGLAMPFMVASVQRLVFENAELQLNLLPDSRKVAADNGWQASLAQAGFEATASDDGWTLRVPSGSAANDTDNDNGADNE
ncbi:type II secretion system protein GspL [Pseudomonas purpurea]|uniref:type II secretion system protein GspL n=1 Tax=Pseudomonas purpurea TaxID=3136737 RepID=UPI0032660442